MLKNKVVLILTMLIIFIAVVPKTVVAADVSSINIDQVEKGIITIDYQSPNGKTTAVRIQKANEKKDHILGGNNTFPLQFGEGNYTVILLENVIANKYKVIENVNFDFKPTDKNILYLQSIQTINWDDDMNAVKKARELVSDADSDLEKLRIIYDFIINSIEYDYDKASNLRPEYKSSIDLTLESGLGICYDYSVLLAAMVRSLNIPAKVVEGRKNDIDSYHSWNEVYLKDIDKWIVIDTTYDVALKMANRPMPMGKDSKEYIIEKVY